MHNNLVDWRNVGHVAAHVPHTETRYLRLRCSLPTIDCVSLSEYVVTTVLNAADAAANRNESVVDTGYTWITKSNLNDNEVKKMLYNE